MNSASKRRRKKPTNEMTHWKRSEREREKRDRSMRLAHVIRLLNSIKVLLVWFGKRTNIDAQDSFVSFVCDKKRIGQGSIYDQQMSEWLFLTNCSFEKRSNHKKSSSVARTLPSVSNELVLLHNANEKEQKKKGKSYSTTFDLCLIIERSVDWQTRIFERAQRKDHFPLRNKRGNKGA